MLIRYSEHFRLIIWGIVLYEIGTFVSIFYGVSPIVFSMFSTFVFATAFLLQKKVSANQLGTSYKVLLLLTIIMLFRGSLIGNYLPAYGIISFDSSLYQIFRHFFFDHYVTSFLMPLVALIPVSSMNLSLCRKYGYILAIISLLLAAYYMPTLAMASSWSDRQLIVGENEFSIRDLSSAIFIGSGFTIFMSYCFQYVASWKKWIFPLGLLAIFLSAVAGAGRGGSAVTFLYIIFFFFIWFKYPYRRISSRSITRLKSILIFAVFVFGIVYMLTSTDFFSHLFMRLFEDDSNSTFAESGREYYVKEMIKDFDGNLLYWLLGKGINGAYYTTIDGAYYRNTIEWGYMFLILKGGILYLLFYVIVLLKASYNGIIKSNNLVCKAFGVMSLFAVVSLIPFGLPSVSITYFLVWIGVRVVHTPGLLKMTDNQIKEYFNL